MTTTTTTTSAGIPPEPADLRLRQRALLADCDLLDVPDDAELDAVTRLAAAVTGFPITMVNLLDTERACQLSAFGFPRMHTERDTSLCHRASLIGGVVTSDECTTDPRFADLPWVDGRWAAVRRYASAPLVVDGLTIGTLCFFDQEPGPALTDAHRAHMADLASVVVSLLERRRDNLRVEASREQLREAHAELVRSRAFESALLEALPVGIVAADADRRVTLRNRVSRHWAECADVDVPLDRLFDEGAVDGVEVQVGAPDGSSLTVACTGSRVLGAAGELLGAVVVLADVTAQRAVEAHLRTAASRDALTGLANRAHFVEELRRSAEEGGAAVLFCDLDGFKAVNDVHGHAAGDAVLVETAARLAGAVRHGDLVARLGGDEFVVLCPGDLSPRDRSALLRRIEAAVSRPVLFAGVPVHVGVSVGTAASGRVTDPEELLRTADAAMYEVKRSRHGTP